MRFATFSRSTWIPEPFLPPDDSLEGLDNLADVLGTSPALIERYIGAAAKISRLAVGDTDVQPLSITYKVRGDVSQDKHIEGLPLGTRGGIVIQHNFPVDGEYLFKFSLLKVNFGPQYGQSAKNEQLEMSMNGVRVLLLDLRSAPYYYIRGGAAGGPAPAPRDPDAGEGRTSNHHGRLHQENRRGRRRSGTAVRCDDGRPANGRPVRIHDGAAPVQC